MKRLLVAILLAVVTTPGYSKALAYTDNQVGTRIVITDQQGCKEGMLAYTTDKQGASHTGCWWNKGSAYIHIRWTDMPSRVIIYPIEEWRTMEPVL